MRNIYVFYPSDIIGGAELLFVRVLNFLSKYNQNSYRVGYINFSKSCINELLENNVEKIIYDESCITLPENSTIVAPPFCLYKFPKIKSKNIFFIFWVLHIKEFTSSMYSVSKMDIKNSINRVRTMVDSNALIAMDEATRLASEEFSSRSLNERYIVPVVLENYQDSSIKSKLINESFINVGWVGRLSFDKIQSLINLMENLEKLDRHIKLHIIGEGAAQSLLNLKKYKNFEVVMVGTLVPGDLSKYLKNEIDICFAMGTSMLEAEKCYIPAVLVFYCEEKFNEDCFLWSFKLKNYILGDKLGSKIIDNNEVMPLNKIIDDFLMNISYYSKKSREHFESFLIDKHIHNFINLANETMYSKKILDIETSKLEIIIERLKFRIKKSKKIKKILNFLNLQLFT